MNNLQAPIPKITAVDYAKNWRAFNANAVVNDFKLNEILPNAFMFDLEDVQALVSDPLVEKVRVYFGYINADPSPDPQEPLPMKIMMIGVDGDGKDIFTNAEPVSGIYDFATPCPATCDYESPLVTG